MAFQCTLSHLKEAKSFFKAHPEWTIRLAGMWPETVLTASQWNTWFLKSFLGIFPQAVGKAGFEVGRKPVDDQPGVVDLIGSPARLDLPFRGLLTSPAGLVAVDFGVEAGSTIQDYIDMDRWNERARVAEEERGLLEKCVDQWGQVVGLLEGREA